MAYIERIAHSTILRASSQFPIVLVTGPRQVGKTTLLTKLNDGMRKYVSLDNPAERALANNDPELFMQRHKPPVIIDEVQYAPGLFSYIKMYVDQTKQMGSVWLTGSQMFHLMKGVSESLAGRVAIITLLGLSSREIYGKIDLPAFVPDRDDFFDREKSKIDLNILYEDIYRGSLPSYVSRQVKDREMFFSSYIQTYMQRDLRDFANVGNESSFYTFLEVVAARTAQMLNLSDIANEIGVSSVTCKKWLSILEASGLVYLLKPYHNNLTKRLVKTPKLYFLDTGLCSYLCGWDSAKTLENSMMSGAFLETYVVSEILKSYYNVGKRPSIYYYRDKDTKEIDILILKDGKVHPIEIKKSGKINKRLVNVFGVLNKLNLQVGEGAVICLYPEVLPIDNFNIAIPVGMI